MIQKALSSMAVLVLLLTAAACNPTEDTGSTSTGTTGTTGTPATSSTTAPPAAGATWGNAPDFAYSTFDGQQKKLSQHLGKPVVVNFWAMS